MTKRQKKRHEKEFEPEDERQGEPPVGPVSDESTDTTTLVDPWEPLPLPPGEDRKAHVLGPTGKVGAMGPNWEEESCRL